MGVEGMPVTLRDQLFFPRVSSPAAARIVWYLP